MTNLSPSSCPFTIGSAIHRKNTKTTQQVNLEHMPKTGRTILHTRPVVVGVDSIETECRAEFDRRADYDRRVETARREEYDKRMTYDQQIQMTHCQDVGKADQIDDVCAQVHRLAQMGTMIELLTMIFMKPTQPEAEAEKITKTVLRHSDAKLFRRKVFRIIRTPRRLDPQEVEVDTGFSHAPETELKDRKILKIRRKKEEEEMRY
jgi:hypothetical protein